MTFLEALYGSQYYEIHQRGKDGNKGRRNGNIFLSVMIILLLFAVIMICISFVPGINDNLNKIIRNVFGYSNSGKSIGRLLGIPLLAITYFIISFTVGSAENFKKSTDAFMNYPDEIKKKANARLLTPFFILLAIVFGLVMFKL